MNIDNNTEELHILEYELALISELVYVLPEEDPLLDVLEERIERITSYIKEMRQTKLVVIQGGK